MLALSDSIPAPPQKHSPAYRALLAAVILLGALIVIGLGVLVAGLAMKLGGHARVPPASSIAQFTLTPGARVVSVDVSGDRLVLRLRSPTGDEIDVIDTETGRLVAKLKSAAPPAAK